MKPDEVDRLLRRAVGELEPAFERALAGAEVEIRARVPELAQVPAIERQLGDVFTGHGRAIRDALRDTPDRDALQLAPITTRFARDCARCDVPVATVLRTYQHGHEFLWRWWTDALAEWIDDADARAAVSARCAELLLAYVSSGMELTVEVHTSEREVRMRGASWQQRDAILAILAGDGHGSTDDLSLQLGYDLHAWHVGFVIWSAEHQQDWVGLETGARDWARTAVGHAPLLAPVDGRSIWGWVSTTVAPSWIDAGAPAPSSGLRAALGQPGHGLAGFRTSHREAVRTQQLALSTDSDAVVLRHGMLATLALLPDDRDELRRYVARALGGLAADRPREARLRSTLRAYLAHGENLRATARALHFHRNTIQQRLELAATRRGRPLQNDRLSLALALEIAERYGAAVLAEGD